MANNNRFISFDDCQKVETISVIQNYDDFIKFECSFGEINVSKYHASFIHDFTIDHSMEKTDTQLEYLSPDFVTDDHILEYSTVMFDNEFVMLSKFKTKFEKYYYLSEKHKKNLYVTIVSPKRVLTNCDNLSDDHALNMVKRLNIALNVKRLCFEKFNLDLWLSENNQRFNRILESVLKNHEEVTPKDDFEKSFEADLTKPNEDDYRWFIHTCIEEMKSFDPNFSDFTRDYEVNGTRFDYKRVIPVSLVIPECYDCRFDHRTILLKPDLSQQSDDLQLKLIEKANSSVLITHNTAKEMEIALNNEEPPEKRTKMMYRFHTLLNDEERITLALRGIQAKKLYKSKNSEILEKRMKDKESFSLDSPVDDIDQFIRSDYLKTDENFTSRSIAKEMYDDWSRNLRDFPLNRREGTGMNERLISSIFEENSKTVIVQYCKFIQALFTEINYSVRENLKEDDFIVKPIPGYNCDVYMKLTGSLKPVFFFIVFKNDFSLGNLTVGVKIHEIGENSGYFYSDWSSIKLRDIENYLSIVSKISSSLAYLQQIYTDKSIISMHLNFILLLILSNKDRDEEIVTLLRYIYMRSASHTDNVTTLTKKLPTCLRSRLNVFQVKQTLNLMRRLHHNRPKIVFKNKDRDVEGLYDIFGNPLNFKQALNFCYYGYCVNKSKQTENNQSSKLIDKILEYDIKVEDGSKLSGVEPNELGDHYHNRRFLSVITQLSIFKVKQTFGDNYFDHFETTLCKTLSKQNLVNLATIKASAKSKLPQNLNSDSLDKLKKRRPKVVESLKELTDQFGSFEHPIELVNYCIKELDSRDNFNVELFSKDQHAGIREIYVVDIKVRIIQWFLETISRCLCQLFTSETMTNPMMKDSISQRITRESMLKVDEPVMLCRSGDASKWSQTQNVQKFYQVLKYYLPVKFHKIIKSILMLWCRKKIFLPVSLIETCLGDTSKLVDNPTINFIKSIYSGEKTDKRLKKNEPFLRIQTGFMQGILHFTSSFFHTIVQEGFSVFKELLVKKLYPESKKANLSFVNIILQGSDDNSEIMILPREFYSKSPGFFNVLVQLKDIMSKYVGIKVSEEKTASCVPFLMEYNSTWELAGKFVMPTIKFVFVSSDIPQKQTLIGRQEFYYSLLENCLEKGCSLKTCSLIRLSQAEQHYLQLGFQHNLLFENYIQMLKINKSPALGYFMFELSVMTGIVGFDFMLYFHSLQTNFSEYIKIEEKEVPIQILNNIGYKSIADYTVSKFQFKRYNEIMDNLSLGSVEVSRENINDRPEILYSSIHDKNLELDLVNLKMHDFSVKESLSSRFSKSEMFSSSIYILSRKVCYFQKKQNSLIKLCIDLNNETTHNNLTRLEIQRTFTRSSQYNDIINDIKPMVNSNILLNETYVQRGSSRIKILDGLNQESYKLLDLCRSKWFGLHTIPIEDTVLNKYFDQAKSYIPWLKDTEMETREFLNCDSFQLYYYLQNSFKDSKFIKLLDTPSKSGSIKYLISRIADESKKLHYTTAQEDKSRSLEDKIKTNIRFLIDYPYNNEYKKFFLKQIFDQYLKCELRFNEKIVVDMIHCVLNKNESEFQSNLCKYADTLNLVIFIKPQKFDEGSSTWKGDGLILGKSGPLIYELMIRDEFAIKISVNNMILAQHGFKSICRVINELKLKFLSHEESNVKLNSSGLKFDKVGVEVVENSFLSFNTASIKNIDVVMENNRVKVISRIPIKDLNDGTLLDDYGEVTMAQIRNIKTKQLEWVPKEVVPKGHTILNEKSLLQKHATRNVTICSLKTHRFFFNKDDTPMFEIDDLAKLFWSQEQSYDKFINDFNYILENNKIVNKSDFINKFRLKDYYQLFFRNAMIGKLPDRDNTIELRDNDDEEPVNMEDVRELLRTLSTISPAEVNTAFDDSMLKDINFNDSDFNLENYVDYDSISSFVKELTQDHKAFYINLVSNGLFENRLFSTIYIKLLTIMPDFHKALENDETTTNLPSNVVNLLWFLFGIKKQDLMTGNEIPDKKINYDDIEISSLLSEKSMLSEILNRKIEGNLYKKYSKEIFTYISELLTKMRSDVSYWEERASIHLSIGMKSIAIGHVNNLKEHLDLLQKLEEKLLKLEEEEKMIVEQIDSPKNKEQTWSKDEVINFITVPEDQKIDLKNVIFMTKSSLMEKGEIPNVPVTKFDVPGDGDCLFHSIIECFISFDSTYAAHHSKNLRKRIVEEIVKFKEIDKIRLAVNGNNEFHDYPYELLNRGVWGDNYCLVAIGNLTDSKFYLRDKNTKEWTNCYGGNPRTVDKAFYLEYENNLHFSPLIEDEHIDSYFENKDDFEYFGGTHKYHVKF